MAITAAERDVLLKRLELARVAKLKKQEEAKAAKAAKAAPEPVAPAPVPAVPEPAPVPEPIQSPPRSEPIPIPEVPDLVKMSRKPAKKACLPVSDDEEEEVVMPKKQKVVKKKEQPYMKLKIYREPTNPQAFQSLLESIHNPPEYEEEERPAPEPPAPQPFIRPPRVLHSNIKQTVRPMIGADRKLEDARAAAMAFFS